MLTKMEERVNNFFIFRIETLIRISIHHPYLRRAMNNEPFKNEIETETDIDSTLTAIDKAFEEIAESSIVKMIITGSGGPENNEITEPGLRFVRFLIARSESYSSGILPNLKDLKCIRELARNFIKQAGTPTRALQLMYQNS